MKYLFSVFLCVITFAMFPADAQAISFGGYFGGRVISSTPCLDGATTLIVVGPPRPGAFAYVQNSVILYNKKMPIQNRWVIGSYIPGGACVTPAGPVPLQGTIRQIGTS